MIEKTIIEATTIPDAWFKANDICYNEGYEYEIEEGSYVGQKRKELDFILIHIKYPSSRPLLPETPDGVSDPVTGGIEFIENSYLSSVMTSEIMENEAYTYGSRIFGSLRSRSKVIDEDTIQIDLISQVYEVINKFRRGFNNNQCCLSISQPHDIFLEDPPCWRSCDLRIYKDEKKLHMYHYFRSWDLWGGLPANLAAFVYLQEYICDEIGNGVTPGEFICMSKGAHCYDYVWKTVRDYMGGR